MAIFLNGKGSVYQQIVDYYKRYISLNIIKPMEKLPSCRALASELGINPNTVERAYCILEKENYIITIPKKGVYVSDNSNKVVDENHINELIKEIKESGISKEKLLKLIDNIYSKDGETHDTN